MSQTLSASSARLVAISRKANNKQIFRALLRLASAALLIRVMGMLNQVIVSGRFGAGSAMDAYFVASALPLFLAQVITSAIEAAVIPVYTRVRIQGTEQERSALFSTLLNLLILAMVLLVIVMLFFRQQMILFSAPALDPFRSGLAIDLAPFIFPAVLLMVVVGFLESLLNAEGQFGWPAYAGMLVPLATAVFVLIAGASQGVVTLCTGMLAGLCLQICAFIVRARRAGFTYRPVLHLRNPEVGSILLAAWPVIFAGVINQASPLVDQIFASALPQGSISALNYSLKLVSVPIGVIFVTVGRAILPYLSRQATAQDMQGFKATLRLYLWVVSIAMLLLTLFTVVLAHPLVQILFQRGSFTSADTSLTATTLIGFLVGLAPMSFSFIISRAFSALGKNQVLIRIAIVSVVANAALDYILGHFLQSQGIALATSVVYLCNIVIMSFTLRRMIGPLNLFTPPQEIQEALRKLSKGRDQYSLWLTIWLEAKLLPFGISYGLRRYITRIGIMLAIFFGGVAGVVINPFYTLRVALGSVVMVVLLRYYYLLLIAWAVMNALNALPIFRGSNILIGLTLPTFLLMAYLPIWPTFKRLPTLIFLLIYVVWVFAGIGISPVSPGAFLTEWVFYLDCLAVAVLTINVLTTRRRMMIFIDVILLLTMFISLYGFYGYITKQSGLPDITTPSLYRIGSIFGIDQGGLGIYQTGGGGPQTLALFLSAIIPLALYRTFTLRGFKRVCASILTLVLLVAVALTFTRSAYISVPLSIIIMALFLPSRKLKISLIGTVLTLLVVAALLATVGNIPILSRFFGQDIVSLNGRTYLWVAVLDRVDPGQFLGHGLHASDVLLTDLHIGIGGHGLIGTSPHNLFLGTLYDQGIIGLILLTAVFVSMAVGLIKGSHKATGDRQILFAMALAVLVSVVLQSIETNDFWTQAFSIYFWAIMALPFAQYWFAPKQSPKDAKEMLTGITAIGAEISQQDWSTAITVPEVEVSWPSEDEEMLDETVRLEATELAAYWAKQKRLSEADAVVLVESDEDELDEATIARMPAIRQTKTE